MSSKMRNVPSGFGVVKILEQNLIFDFGVFSMWPSRRLFLIQSLMGFVVFDIVNLHVLGSVRNRRGAPVSMIVRIHFGEEIHFSLFLWIDPATFTGGNEEGRRIRDISLINFAPPRLLGLAGFLGGNCCYCCLLLYYEIDFACFCLLLVESL